ncbi:hypothetical protein BJ970_001859 [Saccharopolyspora phatthalungensis]|uniref:Uncharacterized protein n=1 Tax=Saccharopolyspora phatthalungensis TaxID=664693 RepID=A0A840Q7F2_9PSEU|nr:hypothetical protein [Saccharopolyspora phatthalungensis]MBB5154325.1 hypothetical protein [Saccharopolyspora phatthalungensis]
MAARQSTSVARSTLIVRPHKVERSCPGNGGSVGSNPCREPSKGRQEKTSRCGCKSGSSTKNTSKEKGKDGGGPIDGEGKAIWHRRLDKKLQKKYFLIYHSVVCCALC